MLKSAIGGGIMYFDGPPQKSLVKVWVPGHISIIAFYEQYYERNVSSSDGERRVALARAPKGSAASISQKRTAINDLVCEIEDAGYCVLAPCDSIFGVYTGYYPIKKKKPEKKDFSKKSLRQLRETEGLSIEGMAKLIGMNPDLLRLVEDVLEPFCDSFKK